MLRRCLARFASPCVVLVVIALAACAPPMVPAPLSARQPPYGPVPTPAPPAAPGLPTPAAEAGPAKVALLVPLSGANADLGQAMLDAAQLALFEAPDDRLTLVPRDTAGSAEGAAKAARAAIGEGARLILGPLLAAEVEAVKPLARDAHLNVIAFSTVTELAGGNTFLMGFLPRQEVVREVGQARERGFGHRRGVGFTRRRVAARLAASVATPAGDHPCRAGVSPGSPHPASSSPLSRSPLARRRWYRRRLLPGNHSMGAHRRRCRPGRRRRRHL